ncbi:hypothetical protein D3C81_2286190 [compost metagenome]
MDSLVTTCPLCSTSRFSRNISFLVSRTVPRGLEMVFFSGSTVAPRQVRSSVRSEA